VLQQISQSIEVAFSVSGAVLIVVALHIIGSTVSRLVINPSMSSSGRRIILAGTVLAMALISIGLLLGKRAASAQVADLVLPVSVGITASIAAIGVKTAVQSGPALTWLGLIDQRALKGLRAITWLAIAFATIVTTSNYAEAVGRADAESTATHLTKLSKVTVYTKQELGLYGLGTSPSAIHTQNSAYSYSYADFRILTRTADKWFFILSSWKPGSGRIYQIGDSPDLRVEFIS
jgi:hypothetical protein